MSPPNSADGHELVPINGTFGRLVNRERMVTRKQLCRQNDGPPQSRPAEGTWRTSVGSLNEIAQGKVCRCPEPHNFLHHAGFYYASLSRLDYNGLYYFVA